jgi:hypothetical protein
VAGEVNEMTESTTTPPATTGATKARRPRGAAKTDTGPIVVSPEAGAAPSAEPSAPTPDSTQVMDVPATPPPATAAPHATAPVTVRPKPRGARSGPLTRMGPWAPVAGGLLGLVLGAVAVLLLAGTAESFEDRLALVFTVLGLGMLGTAGVLLADEVRMMRQRARDAVVRPAWVEATAGLLNGLTPARLLLMLSGFVLFLAAFVSRG